MGVPVVTRPGETFASRHACSHLNNAGLGELVTRDLSEYAARAVELASDPARLASRRGSQREQMTHAALCHGQRFAGSFEAAIRGVWKSYVAAAVIVRG